MLNEMPPCIWDSLADELDAFRGKDTERRTLQEEGGCEGKGGSENDEILHISFHHL